MPYGWDTPFPHFMGTLQRSNSWTSLSPYTQFNLDVKSLPMAKLFKYAAFAFLKFRIVEIKDNWTPALRSITRDNVVKIGTYQQNNKSCFLLFRVLPFIYMTHTLHCTHTVFIIISFVLCAECGHIFTYVLNIQGVRSSQSTGHMGLAIYNQLYRVVQQWFKYTIITENVVVQKCS